MQREWKYDFLRIFATYSVILMHVGWDYCDGGQAVDKSYMIGAFFVGLTRFAVPCFLMMSGAFLLGNERNRDWKYFYKKSFQKLGLPLLAISAVYVLYYYVRNLFVLKNILTYEGLAGPIRDWFYGIPGKHLWYMYMLCVMYIAVPWLIRIKDELSDGQWKKLAFILLILGIISNLTSTYVVNWGLEAIRYIGYLLVGNILYEHNLKFMRGGYWNIIIGILGFLALGIVYAVVHAKQLVYFEGIGAPLSVYVVCFSCILFKGIAGIDDV